jgi:hypothetical protein
MPDSTSNLFIDVQQVVATTKRKEDDFVAAAQAAGATAHQEQKTLVAAVAAARKTLDEARAFDRAAILAWKKEKSIAHHLE